MKLVQTGGSRKPRKVPINLALGTWTLDIMTLAARTNVLKLLHTQLKILSNCNFVPKHMRELAMVDIKLILLSSKQAKATTIWTFMFASVDLPYEHLSENLSENACSVVWDKFHCGDFPYCVWRRIDSFCTSGSCLGSTGLYPHLNDHNFSCTESIKKNVWQTAQTINNILKSN